MTHKELNDAHAKVVQEMFRMERPKLKEGVGTEVLASTDLMPDTIPDRFKYECKICWRIGCTRYNENDGHQYPRTDSYDYNANYPGYEGL